MNIRKQTALTFLFLGSLLLTSNSIAQEINRDTWSLSSSQNAANTFSAIDGNNNTRWTTRQKQSDGQYFEVDFNRATTFNQVVLDTTGSSNDYPREYELQISNNGSTWETIAADEPEASGRTEINFSTRTSSHMRILQKGSTSRFWWSIHELNVFNNDDNTGDDNPGNASTDFSDSNDWSLTASTNSNTRLALDNNARTRWTTTSQTQRSGQFYEIDFNARKSFDRVLLDTTASKSDYPRAYEVQVSNDGNSWTTVASGTPNNSARTLITFPQQTAEFLRIEQNGSNNRFWWSIHEMTISSGEIDGGGDDDGDDLDGLHPDIVRLADISDEEILRNPGGEGWKDSYSVGDRCYCDTTFDHDIGRIRVNTPVGNITVREACGILGDGPGSRGRPIYNDIQCGNGPANDAGDEDYCPGRVDIGREGCRQIGPVWNFD